MLTFIATYPALFLSIEHDARLNEVSLASALSLSIVSLFYWEGASGNRGNRRGRGTGGPEVRGDKEHQGDR